MSRKLFHFSEGTSSKFWEIRLYGNSFTVCFGKIGTSGQTQTKEFDSDQKAIAAHQKLIDEKVKKGYVQVESDESTDCTQAAAPASPSRKAKPAKEESADVCNAATARSTIEPDVTAAVVDQSRSLLTNPSERFINLEPEDWFWAPWRQPHPLPRPKPRSFNRSKWNGQVALPDLAQPGDKWNSAHALVNLVQPAAITPAEARFWLHRLSFVNAAEITNPPLLMTRAEFESLIQEPEKHSICIPLILPATLMSVSDFFDWYSDYGHFSTYGEFRRRVLVHLNEEDRQTLRDILRPKLSLSKINWHQYVLAAALGMHNEISELLDLLHEQPTLRAQADAENAHIELLCFGLNNSEALVNNFRRFDLTLDRIKKHSWGVAYDLYENSARSASSRRQAYTHQDKSYPTRAFLAHEPYSGLDLVTTFEDLARVIAPETAERMITLLLADPKVASLARRWMEENVAVSLPSILPLVTSSDSKKTAFSRAYIERLSLIDLPSIDAALSNSTRETATAVREIILHASSKQEALTKIAAALATAADAKGEIPATKRIALPVSPLQAPIGKINLSPEEWYRALGTRKLTPLPRPVERSFSTEAALQAIEELPAHYERWYKLWEQTSPPFSLSKSEASFWLRAFLSYCDAEKQIRHLRDRQVGEKDHSAQETELKALIVDQLRQTSGEEELTYQATIQLLTRIEESRIITKTAGIPILLATVLQPSDFMNFVLEVGKPNAENLNAFRNLVLPYLEHEVIEQLRTKVQEQLRPELLTTEFVTDWRRDSESNAAFHTYRLAAMLGMNQDILRVVKMWTVKQMTPARYSSEWRLVERLDPQAIILGLSDPGDIRAQFTRLKMGLRNSHEIVTWIAKTEHQELKFVVDSILQEKNWSEETLRPVLDALARVESTQTAIAMLELSLKGKLYRYARTWLETHLNYSIPGLLSIAAGDFPLTDAALAMLHSFKRLGNEQLLRDYAAGLSPELQHELEEKFFSTYEELDSDEVKAWLDKLSSRLVKTKVQTPDWLKAGLLPPPAVGQHTLTQSQCNDVLQGLQNSSLDNIHPLITSLKLRGGFFDKFVFGLFEEWLRAGAPTKDKWALTAVGLLGSDESAVRLTPYLRVWPGENQHPRAVLGMECLRHIGTDTALMQINSLAQKLKFQALKQRATECMEEIADTRGLSRDELEDRIVPDCGLSEDGQHIFDFGSRQFRFVLSSEMKPMIREPDGKLKADLPKPGTKDDADKARVAAEEWKLLKLQLKDIAKIQPFRLEQAMITGRCWTVDEFNQLLVRHPLMGHIARMVVWGLFNKSQEPKSEPICFRVCDDRTFADDSDNDMKLDSNLKVGIVHPMHLSATALEKWGEIFSDYKILQPFVQLGRPVYRLDDAELAGNTITRFKTSKVPGVTIVSGLDKNGWTRGSASDHGVLQWHTKYFSSCGVTAVACYEGVPIDRLTEACTQSIERCFFVRDTARGWYDAFYNGNQQLLLWQVDPLVVSEVLMDLSTISAKTLAAV